jgi:VIT1/CCC1 family predicted Fe2+/Mn2+ transporter
MVFLALLGVIAENAGESSILKCIIRICFWGIIAMDIIAIVGYIFGVKTA